MFLLEKFARILKLASVCLVGFVIVSACSDDKKNPFEAEEIVMFPFLKVGNVFTYQCDYPVECGTGYVGDIMKISIDSTSIIDNATMYYGTYTFYARTMAWYDDGKIDTVYVQTENNIPLFIVRDSVVNFVFAGSLKIPYNSEIGTVVDSMFNFDNELVYCKFDKIGDYAVYKQTDNYESERILYKNCFQAGVSCSKNWGQGFYSSSAQKIVYSTNYGLIVMSKIFSSPIGSEGSTLSLIEIN